MSAIVEANVDALPGPTHLFSGLGVGNLASKRHSQSPSRPKQAALESLHKAELVAQLGVPQFIWVPPRRPDRQFLQASGFGGSAEKQMSDALREAPELLQAALSSAFMWAANSGTFSTSVDCADGKHHFTPANLISSLHRGSEASERAGDLASLFGQNQPDITIHSALPSVAPMRDEGAANHMRLSNADGDRAINIFVYGDSNRDDRDSPRPTFYPRQTLASVEAIARTHRLPAEAVVFVRQHNAAISAGAFHNDVIATSHRDVLVFHERAFEDGNVVEEIQERFRAYVGESLRCFRISQEELSLENAVKSYLFNSQILTPVLDSGSMVLVCPKQCESNTQARAVIERLLSSEACPIEQVHFVSLDQSMAGGGGPACVRLRLPLPVASLDAAFGGTHRLTRQLSHNLKTAIEIHYPDSIVLDDFLDPNLLDQTNRACEALRAAVGQAT
ncbi:MAG: N-succinylarginine dihydrolase [Aureliella sp.]